MSKQAFLFPGQASQFVGMGKELIEAFPESKLVFEEANDILGFNLSKIMFEGTEEKLKETNITQPSVFLHSIISAKFKLQDIKPDAVAGHSLGEISALVSAKAINFKDGLLLVKERSNAMYEACIQNPGTMAAIVGLEDSKIEEICCEINDDVCVAANYNCPGQLVISGSLTGIKKAETLLLAAGAKRVIILNVGGAFHSPLMSPAKERLATMIQSISFKSPECPIYQNVNSFAQTDSEIIKSNLIQQLTSPVLWTQTIQAMLKDGITEFIEVGGNGTVLSGFMKRIDRNANIRTA
jgi:[acyl-carrier-protein] S-malonyltransferase